LTSPTTHIWRLLKWGRTLAKHGALTGLENNPATPPRVKRLIRIARFGARVPKQPEYAKAFEAIGPAAIKLGQSLATRPDLVGEEATRDLGRLQDALPPVPFATVRPLIEGSLGGTIEFFFKDFNENAVGSASIAQVYKAVTAEGRTVAVKVLRPGIEAQFARDIETYEWAAAQIAAMGGELARLRPRETIAQFRIWTERELDLRREASSASELRDSMLGETGYVVPEIDWKRTSRRVMTLDWFDGIKISDKDALVAAGHDLGALAVTLVRAFLRQAIAEGFFHADLHQGNLFALPDGRIGAIDFGIMGRVNRQARLWLAEILHGLITGNYRRVAEIHFEAKYVPAHHNVDDFTTALRSVGEPIRGVPVKDISIGNMLDGLFAITREFDMPTQPHLLLLQKTMVMVEGVASTLDPEINMWETSGPFVANWLRDELGPEAKIASAITTNLRTLMRLPDLVERLEEQYPPKGAAPPPPPLPDIAPLTFGGGWRTATIIGISALGGAAMFKLLQSVLTSL
jgi:ubiquinone biosynthesis protein